MRVLLVSANTELAPDPVYPIGAAAVGAAATRAGHEVEAIDLCFAADRRALVSGAIERFRPEVVGISLRNLDDTAYPATRSFIDDYRALVAWVRQASGAPVVLGGSGFTVMPAVVLGALRADYGVAGEGETVFPWLLERLGSGRAVESDASILCRRMDGATLVSARARIGALDDVVLPDRGLFDAPRYYERGGCLNVQTKRGCGFECVFCSYPLIDGKQVRARRPERVVDEIESMQERFGARHVFFVDSVFNYPPSHATRVCEEIVARGLDVEWSAYLTPKLVDEELVEAMAASGCSGVDFGTDSGAPMVIANLHKALDVEDLRRASRLCRQRGIKFAHSLIFGGPGETAETVEQTLALMDELEPTAVIAFVGIRIFPGTGMVDIAIRDGQIEPADDLLVPRFYVSDAMDEDVVARIERHAASHSSWIVPGRGIRNNVRLLSRLRDKKIKGPLWRLLR